MTTNTMPSHLRDNPHGFALVSVVWLASIGFLAAMALLGLLSGKHRSIQQSQYSLEESLALDELQERIQRYNTFLPRGWGSPRDTTVAVGIPEFRFQVSIRRWGMWAIVEITNAHTDILVTRYVLSGQRNPAADTIGFIRTNQTPLIVAHEARLLGSMVIADSIITRPWKGVYYRGPVPTHRTGVECFQEYDVLGGLNTQVQRWSRNLTTLPKGIQVLSGYSAIQHPPPDSIDTIIVLGDTEIAGIWSGKPICLYAQGDITFTPGTLFSGQVIAQGVIDIAESHFLWPSLVVSQLQPGRATPSITVRDGTQIHGSLITTSSMSDYLQRDESMHAHVHLDPTSSITGAVYSEGSLWMQGKLKGWVEVGETYDRAAPVTYHNWILGGTWETFPRREQLPLFPLMLSNGPLQSSILEGVR